MEFKEVCIIALIANLLSYGSCADVTSSTSLQISGGVSGSPPVNKATPEPNSGNTVTSGQHDSQAPVTTTKQPPSTTNNAPKTVVVKHTTSSASNVKSLVTNTPKSAISTKNSSSGIGSPDGGGVTPSPSVTTKQPVTVTTTKSNNSGKRTTEKSNTSTTSDSGKATTPSPNAPSVTAATAQKSTISSNATVTTKKSSEDQNNMSTTQKPEDTSVSTDNVSVATQKLVVTPTKAQGNTSNATQKPDNTASTTQEPIKPSNGTIKTVSTSSTTLKPHSTPVSTLKPNESASTQKPDNASVSTQKPSSTSVSTQKPDNASVPTQKPGSTSVSTQKPGSTSVSTQKPDKVSVSTQKPDNTSVSTQKPDNASVSTQKPDNTSVSTQKPDNTSVSTQKQDNASVPTQKPDNTSVSTQKPDNTSVSTQKPDNTSVSTQKQDNASVSTQNPGNTSVSTQKPGNTSVSTQKPGNTSVSTQKPNETTATTQKPERTSSQKPGITTLPPARDEFVYINEIMVDRNGGFQKVELQLSKQFDVTHYAMVMVDGRTNKKMSVVYLKDMILQKNGLLVVSFNSSQTLPSMQSMGTGVAIYDMREMSLRDDWTVSEAGLVDALVIGKTYTSVSEHLTNILTPGVNPFILDPNKYGMSKTISRCSSEQLRSTDMFALINPSFGTDNKKKCQEIRSASSDFAIKIKGINCSVLEDTNKPITRFDLTVKKLIHYIVKKVNTKCQCGVTWMHIIDPIVHCCDGASVDMSFVAPNKNQLKELKDIYINFIKNTQHVNVANHLYQIDNKCYENCCHVSKHPKPQPSNSDDTAKNVKVTVAVIVSCLIVFMIVVVIVIMYMRRKKSAVYQFRMSRLDEEDDLVIDGPDQEDFVGGQEATFDTYRR